MTGTLEEPEDKKQKLLEFAIDHSWKYFAFHAEQRMKVFNFFFLAINALVAAAAGAAYAKLWVFVAFSGFAVFFVSIIFYVLDRRNKQLVEIGELALIDFQKELGLKLSSISPKREDYYRCNLSSVAIDWNPMKIIGIYCFPEFSRFKSFLISTYLGSR
jgi:hypothetical protein